MNAPINAQCLNARRIIKGEEGNTVGKNVAENGDDADIDVEKETTAMDMEEGGITHQGMFLEGWICIGENI